MATPTDRIATYAGMALPSVVTAGGRVIRLPPEIVDVVLELLGDEKGALSSMICTSKSMLDHTVKFFWKTATLEMRSKLPGTPHNRRQRYAGAIREINITIGPYQILPPPHDIMFSQLKRLATTHDSMQPVYIPDEAEMPETITRSERAGALASLVSRHAPKLEGLCFTGPEFGQDVKIAWEALHENRKPNMAYYNVYPLAPLKPKFLQ
ncbi:hypothetical protein KCV07_g6740, partial [Aureobasidium melanogenum]